MLWYKQTKPCLFCGVEVPTYVFGYHADETYYIMTCIATVHARAYVTHAYPNI